MSGDVVLLRAPADSIFARGFAQLARLPVDTVPWALVGGLGVAARLAGAFRATSDIDAVSPDVDDLVEMLVRSGGVRTGGRVRLQGVPVDAIPVPGSGGGRLPNARSWAFDTATPVRVVVLGPDGETLADANPAVATRAALVLMKLESAVHGYDRSAAKQATDIYDVLRLIAPALAILGAELASAPRALRADAAQCARTRLIRDPPRRSGT
ncbi:MAG TPA: hypothetical protein VNA20_15995 [Frankiaceae bacterium]|nr:hypothetical protein [Frankiaceae bacterium]